MELVIGALMANYCRDPAHPRVYETEVPQHDD
jgi:hypothetical protein